MQKPWEKYDYHPVSEKVVHILRQQTQNTKSDTYFRVVTSFFLAQMAASMRTNVITNDRGAIPVNAYVCSLAESGAGKGHSLNVLEDQLVNGFKEEFTQNTFKTIATTSMEEEAARKAVHNQSDYQDELDQVQKEFDSYGAMPYSFAEGTGPAYKQVRTKCQIAGVGSLNYICDEIGSNLLTSEELMRVCLETFDIGKVKDKITKASSDNKRHEPRPDPVPSNMLVFGTPNKVFDSGKVEAEFVSLLDTGYARRFFYGFGNKGTDIVYTAEELYDLLAQNTTSADLQNLSHKFKALADPLNYKRDIPMERDEGIALLQYKLDCEALAEAMPAHEHIRKAEMNHRYFKALKLAGAYAFVDCASKVSIENLYAAIKITEDSGVAFEQIMTRPAPYVRLAQYIASCGKDATHADLTEALPFYRGSAAARNELLQLAQAWGIRNNIILKRFMSEGIEFLTGETLKVNDLTEIIVSYSTHEAYHYKNTTAPFDKLHVMTQHQQLHWVNHHLLDGHRLEENCQVGFNTVVLDIDGGTTMERAKELLEGYTALFYTTKRHLAEKEDNPGEYYGERFRIILPIGYDLKLDKDDYVEFMRNLYTWLPFDIDESTSQRSRKWQSHNGSYEYIEGVVLDPLQFIPKTSKNEARKEILQSMNNADSTERWFMNKMIEGDRNNQMIKYALMLVDSGLDYDVVEERLISFNSKLAEPLPEDELGVTVLRTVARKYV